MRWEYTDRFKEQVKVLCLKQTVEGKEVGEVHEGQTPCQAPSKMHESGAQVYSWIGDIILGVISIEMEGKAKGLGKITHKVIEMGEKKTKDCAGGT